MEYYIKKLGHQELGSIKEDGRPSRGRYIKKKKNKEMIKFQEEYQMVEMNIDYT